MEQTYVHWLKRFIHFHKLRPPREVGVAKVKSFLNSLSVNRHCSVNTQRIVLNVLVCLYKRFYFNIRFSQKSNTVTFQLFRARKRLEPSSQS
ncbi:site-specific integrase [Microbulbifer sp. CnH-101-G]|uniref:site-specific integrase n=1 Tax=Microbulbifer sp. CnH-101-G TaxID=3243393 RepID=UPI00403928E9